MQGGPGVFWRLLGPVNRIKPPVPVGTRVAFIMRQRRMPRHVSFIHDQGEDTMTYTANYPARTNNWIDQFFNDFDRTFSVSGRAAASFVPAVDVVEQKEAYELRAELPGVAREDISVEVKDNHLVLSGKKEAVARGEEGHYR